MATDDYRALMDLEKEAGLMGPELTKWVKEQLDDLTKQEREEREEQRRYEEEQRQLEDTREGRRRQHELALKEEELQLEKARKESAEAMAIQQASNPTCAAPKALISSINSLVPKWTEEEPEAWLEEIELLFENCNTTKTEKALVLTKHMEGKAKAALRSLEKSQSDNMGPSASQCHRWRANSVGDEMHRGPHHNHSHSQAPGHNSLGHANSPPWHVDAPKPDSPRGYDLQLGQESLSQPNSSHLPGIAPLGPSSGMPDHQLLPVPLVSAKQCHALSTSDVEPPLEEDPVPDPDHEADPPLGDPGPVTALILATYEPPAPDTSSSPNLFPEDEPPVDQAATPSLGDQELASPGAEVETAHAPVVAAAGERSLPVASDVTLDFVPASPSDLSP
ncbi:uncharacterized protein [Macrobrachium rosenbergii]|uniref:uncharacterized protein n=1 Tax=Macrobrachium rosenbergii TaxID=79674 RepID=UPI0034D5FAD2